MIVARVLPVHRWHPSAIEVTNQGYGWFLYHDGHMHISMVAILFADGFESGGTSAWN